MRDHIHLLIIDLHFRSGRLPPSISIATAGCRGGVSESGPDCTGAGGAREKEEIRLLCHVEVSAAACGSKAQTERCGNPNQTTGLLYLGLPKARSLMRSEEKRVLRRDFKGFDCAGMNYDSAHATERALITILRTAGVDSES